MSKKQDIALLLARFLLAAILIAHAVAALRGFNNKPFAGVEELHLPHWMASVAIWVELISGILLLAGKFTRIAAALVMIHMLLGVRVHWHEGFLYSADFPLALATLALIFLAFGSGKYGFDALKKS